MVAILQLGIFLTMSICLVSATNSTYYLFYAPKRFTPDEGLSITVILSGVITTETTITAELWDGDAHISQESTVLAVGSYMAYMKIKPNNLEKKYYTLQGYSKGGVEFKTKMTVSCESERFVAFVQTDKPIYKPGETVKFRAFSLRNNLTTRSEPMVATVNDANQNLLYNFSLTGNNGVYNGQFGIASRPALGTWNIKVTQEGAEMKQSITVDKYVLPKFEVTIDTDKWLYTLGKRDYTNIVVNVSVKAKYTQGKPVSGTANLKISEFCMKDKSFSQTMKGEANFLIRLDELITEGSYCNHFQLNASIINKLNNKVLYADIVTTYITDYPIFITNSDTTQYVPKEMSDFKFFLKRNDGLPLSDKDVKNPLEVSLLVDKNITQTMSVVIPKDGVVTVSFISPNTVSLTLKVIYNGEHKSKKYERKQNTFYSAMTYNDHNIYLTRLDQNVKNKAFFQVTSFEPMEKFFYSVLSNNMVIMSRVVLLSNETTSNFSVDLLPSMFPMVHVLVNYCRRNGELNLASVSVPLERSSKEMIDATYTNSSLKPGSNAELVIRAIPGSTVFVGAVDKSVLLLSKPDNIDYEKIIKGIELKGREAGNMRYRGFDDFSKLDLQFETNLKLFPTIMYDGDIVFMEKATSSRKSAAKPKVRTLFPETWIWDSVDIQSGGESTLIKKAPDTITTWVTTLFAVHPTEGLSILKDPVTLRIFQDFYIALEIPYSVIRGEMFELNVYIFKYTNKEEMVTVVLNSTGTEVETQEIKMSAKMTEVSVKFMMKPKAVGNLPVLVTASCSSSSDAVKRFLLVKPEGSVNYMNVPLLVNVTQDNPFKKTVDIIYPKNVVEGSKVVTVSVIGDLMGPVLGGLERLIRLPTGCGEQTMLSLYPNVLVYMYLKGRGQLRESVKSKIEGFISSGYQNELSYQHSDGSFSAFGEQDKSGSTWLTAYVLKCFCEAKYQVPGVIIDSNVIKKAANWLIKQQDKSGKFMEPGKVIHADMQGGTASGFTMTTFVLISLLQSQELKLVSAENATTAAAETLQAWTRNRMAKDPYSLSMVLTAFALLRDDDYFDMVNKQLLSTATNKDTMMYWESSPSSSSQSTKRIMPKKADSRSVSTAAYVLLAYSYKHKITEGILIQNYLLKQRNSYGGFGSTQDTVLGLEALSRFASLTSVIPDSIIDVEIETAEVSKYNFPAITTANSMILSMKEIPADTTSVDIKANGTGYALAQVSWQYNLIPDLKPTDSNLNIVITRVSSNADSIVFNVCNTYTGKGSTGMVIVSIDILSGYSVNLVTSSDHSLIMMSEVKDDQLFVYLDSLEIGQTLCFPVTMELEIIVKNMRPQVAEVALYYEPEYSAITSYTHDNFCNSCNSSSSSSVLQSTFLVLILSTTVFKLLM